MKRKSTFLIRVIAGEKVIVRGVAHRAYYEKLFRSIKGVTNFFGTYYSYYMSVDITFKDKNSTRSAELYTDIHKIQELYWIILKLKNILHTREYKCSVYINYYNERTY